MGKGKNLIEAKILWPEDQGQSIFETSQQVEFQRSVVLSSFPKNEISQTANKALDLSMREFNRIVYQSTELLL